MTPLSEVRAALEYYANPPGGFPDKGPMVAAQALTHLAEVEAEYAACQKTTDEIALAHKKGLVLSLIHI